MEGLRLSLTFNKIPWLFPALEKIVVFPWLFPDRGNPEIWTVPLKMIYVPQNKFIGTPLKSHENAMPEQSMESGGMYITIQHFCKVGLTSTENITDKQVLNSASSNRHAIAPLKLFFLTILWRSIPAKNQLSHSTFKFNIQHPTYAFNIQLKLSTADFCPQRPTLKWTFCAYARCRIDDVIFFRFQVWTFQCNGKTRTIFECDHIT